MDRSQFLFQLVDVLCDPFQNYKKYRGITVKKDVAFSDTTEAKADIYYKNDDRPKKLPILVNVHGGGFVKGGKSHRRSLSSRFASEGWFVVNTDYRLAPQFAYPAALFDLAELLNRLPEWASIYGLDLSKIVLTGDSAGGYYAAQLAAAATNETLRIALNLPDISVKIAAVMAFSGAYHIQKAVEKKIPFGITRVIGNDLLGVKLEKDFRNLKDVPMFPFLNVGDFVTENYPKTFVTYAKKDFFVAGQGEEFTHVLNEKGVDVTVDFTTRFMDNHCYYLNFYTKASKRCMKKVSAFLKEVAEA